LRGFAVFFVVVCFVGLVGLGGEFPVSTADVAGGWGLIGNGSWYREESLSRGGAVVVGSWFISVVLIRTLDGRGGTSCWNNNRGLMNFFAFSPSSFLALIITLFLSTILPELFILSLYDRGRSVIFSRTSALFHSSSHLTRTR
jgi:hypothetical protein